MESSDQERAVLNTAVGKVLRRLSRADYFIEGKPSEDDIGPLELEFEDGFCLTFDVNAEEQVTVDPTPLVFPEPRDGYSPWKRVILSDREPWSSMIGLPCSCCEIGWIRQIYGGPMPSLINGFKVRFGPDDFLCFWQFGDDAKILFSKSPPPFGPDFIIDWQPI